MELEIDNVLLTEANRITVHAVRGTAILKSDIKLLHIMAAAAAKQLAQIYVTMKLCDVSDSGTDSVAV